jgi:hypothetical protein
MTLKRLGISWWWERVEESCYPIGEQKTERETSYLKDTTPVTYFFQLSPEVSRELPSTYPHTQIAK